MHAVDRRAQLAHELQIGDTGESLTNVLATEADLPLEAGLGGIVDDGIGMGKQQMPIGLQCVRDPTGEPREGEAVADIVENLAADDQIKAPGNRVAPHVELHEADIAEVTAAKPGSLERGFGDVGREQGSDPRCQLDAEMAFGAGQLQDPVRGTVRQQLERLLVLSLLVGGE